MDVLLGDIRHAVGGGGAEVPGVKGGYDFVIHFGAKGLQDEGGGDVALGIDGVLFTNVTQLRQDLAARGLEGKLPMPQAD